MDTAGEEEAEGSESTLEKLWPSCRSCAGIFTERIDEIHFSFAFVAEEK